MVECLKLKKQVEKAVVAASKIMRRNFQIEEKGGVENIVTTADLGVQNFLCKRLAKLLPSAGFFCEEEDKKDVTSEYIWCIDPIDGTTNFARGIADCCISVGLLHRGEVVLGVVYAPFSKKLFSAVKGQGATLNGQKISVSKKPFRAGIFCTAMSLYKKEFAGICNQILCEGYSQCADFRRFGSCALELCYLAAGWCDLFFEIRVFPWDYAGATIILKEAGGIIKGFDGKEPSLTSPSPVIAANNWENYQKLNEIVQKHMKKIPY